MCGEHTTHADGLIPVKGSSPRVRGTRGIDGGGCRRAGIIPACAGNTTPDYGCTRRGRDHPRVCGEHPDPARQGHHDRGSSPRVRGTPPSVRTVSRPSGIIPACAGNTATSRRAARPAGDHPRVCGEHLRDMRARRLVLGSSPRVRGTPIRCLSARRATGIIPACAGNTQHFNLQNPTRGDHPRVCGEHTTFQPPKSHTWGSSPRVRGTLSTTLKVVETGGIIPACAGNTAVHCRRT